MMEILKAYLKAVRSLFLPGVFVHFLWPPLLAFLSLALSLYWGLVPAVHGLKSLAASLPWAGAFLSEGYSGAASGWIMGFMLVLLSGLLAFVLSSLLIATVSMPMMLDHVAASAYADLEARRGGSFAGSAWNALKALVLLCVLGAICLPVFFVPGLGFVALLALSAWFNLRCFRYDALMNHADERELREVPRRRRLALFLIGVLGAILGLVPVLNLLAAPLSGLAFTHYLLSALRSVRAERQ